MTHRTSPFEGYASYLIRFWHEHTEDQAVTWQAQIESIQTGQSWHFASLEALLTFLEQAFPPAAKTGKS